MTHRHHQMLGSPHGWLASGWVGPLPAEARAKQNLHGFCVPYNTLQQPHRKRDSYCTTQNITTLTLLSPTGRDRASELRREGSRNTITSHIRPDPAKTDAKQQTSKSVFSYKHLELFARGDNTNTNKICIINYIFFKHLFSVFLIPAKILAGRRLFFPSIQQES